MDRGWFCIWRKIEDNISWSRGIEYRGIIMTILQKANWKKGFFLGHEILPGQFPTSAEKLGKDLKISRQKCQRALAQLARDNFIKVENVSNRFTLITVINWDTYQEKKEKREQQVSNQRATSEQQVGTIKQGNKETKKQNNMPASGQDSGQKQEKKKPANKSMGKIEYPAWLNVEAFDGFLQDRKERKCAATPRAVKGLITALDKACGGNHYLQAQVIEKAITNSWKSFFPLKPDEIVPEFELDSRGLPVEFPYEIDMDVIKQLKAERKAKEDGLP